ncbi:MAG: prenyltransferase/squalene oxidase repeat-containing protein, partial [Verrucomicrobiota bacterium]
MLDALTNARRVLLDERVKAGHWEGELSTSALSTATALVALGSVDEEVYAMEVKRACTWLIDNQNEDGGWGDTTKSFSNISTTLLCWSALTRFGGGPARETCRRASFWIPDYVGSLNPQLIAETV